VFKKPANTENWLGKKGEKGLEFLGESYYNE
jgi:hypothetical protein